MILSIGYKQSQGDHTLFINHSATGGVTILIVYVDDIVIIENDEEGMRKLKECLVGSLKLKI